MEHGNRTTRITCDAVAYTETLTVDHRTQIYTETPPPTEPPAQLPAASTITDLVVGRVAEIGYDPMARVAIRIILAHRRPTPIAVGLLKGIGWDNTLQLDTDADGRIDQQVPRTPRRLQYLGSTRIEPEQLPLLVGLPVEVYSDHRTPGDTFLRAALPPIHAASAIVTATGTAAGIIVSGPTGPLALTLVPGTEVRTQGGSVPAGILRSNDRVRAHYTQLPSGTAVALQLDCPQLRIERTAGRLRSVDLNEPAYHATPSRASRLTILPDTPNYLSENYLGAARRSLDEVAGALSTYRSVTVRTEYVRRGKARLVTRTATDTAERVP